MHMRWCVHHAFRRWRSALGLVLVWIQIRVSMMVFSSSFKCGHAVLDLFSAFSNSLSAPEVLLTAAGIDRRSPCPGTTPLFLSQSRSDLNTHWGALALSLLRRGKKNIQASDRQMIRQKISQQFVLDRSSFALIAIAASAAAPRLP